MSQQFTVAPPHIEHICIHFDIEEKRERWHGLHRIRLHNMSASVDLFNDGKRWSCHHSDWMSFNKFQLYRLPWARFFQKWRVNRFKHIAQIISKSNFVILFQQFLFAKIESIKEVVPISRTYCMKSFVKFKRKTKGISFKQSTNCWIFCKGDVREREEECLAFQFRWCNNFLLISSEWHWFYVFKTWKSCKSNAVPFNIQKF